MKTKNIINVAVAEDHIFVRQGLIGLLERVENINILFDVNNGQELIDTLSISQEPDVILLDIQMPVMDGKEAIEIINVKFPNIKVIILSSYFEDIYIKEFTRLGAKAFLPKECDIREITKAINTVYTSGFYYDSIASTRLVKEIKPSEFKQTPTASKIKLTEQEFRILSLLVKYKTNEEIAKTLSIGLRTVEWHRFNLMQKTESKSLIALIKYASDHKLF